MSQGFFKDPEGRTVLWQAPNPAIIGWAVFAVLAHLSGSPKLAWLSLALLFTWAFLELFQGASWFRRLLGLVVLGVIIAGQLR